MDDVLIILPGLLARGAGTEELTAASRVLLVEGGLVHELIRRLEPLGGPGIERGEDKQDCVRLRVRLAGLDLLHLRLVQSGARRAARDLNPTVATRSATASSRSWGAAIRPPTPGCPRCVACAAPTVHDLARPEAPSRPAPPGWRALSAGW